jgi:thiamine transporter ThiT
MTRFHYRQGAARALVGAGPSFMLLILLGEMLRDPSDLDLNEIWVLLPILLIAMVVGMAIAFLPILLGGLAMSYLGARWIVARHPIIWAGIGATMGMLMALLFDESARFWLVLPFAMNGAICAVIVRYGTRWSDDDSV